MKRLQLAEDQFRFDLIVDSPLYQRYLKYTKDMGLIKDVCIYRDMRQMTALTYEDYLNVVQKSDLWLHLRSLAVGTASAVGKRIKGPTRYPTIEQITEVWKDYLENKPFSTEPTTRAHMKWGVEHEDVALTHFAIDNNVCVGQVGTIHLPWTSAWEYRSYFNPEDQVVLETCVKQLENWQQHFLISPDGLVGQADPDTPYDSLPSQIIGMLEIKCASPFHHLKNDDETLSWVANIEKRQWYRAQEIPYVYITQICLQALSGLHRFSMSGNDIMWFIRWTPNGFSEFKVLFEPLVRMGIVSCLLYLLLTQRITRLDELPFHYSDQELPLVNLLEKCYEEVCQAIDYRYVDHSNLYPQFKLYQQITQDFHFVVD
jgi:hypothetical protein